MSDRGKLQGAKGVTKSIEQVTVKCKVGARTVMRRGQISRAERGAQRLETLHV